MNYANAKSLTAKKFKRRFGVEKKTFERMLEAFKQQIPEQPLAGRPWELGREDQILASLEYWREGSTYFHIATDFGGSESTICRAVHRVENLLMASGCTPFARQETINPRRWSTRSHCNGCDGNSN